MGPERWLLLRPERLRFPALLRRQERRPVRGPSMGPERWLLQRQERMLCPPLCRPQERRPSRGQGLPQPSGGREKLGQRRSQNADTRSQNSPKNKNLWALNSPDLAA